jgi:hypothetical protein
MNNLYYLLIGILLTNVAGFSRAIFECIILFNTLTTKHGWSTFWSRENFVASKDVNRDGKITYWENSFPINGGHIIKWPEIIGLLYGNIFLLLYGHSNLNEYWFTWYYILCPIISIAINSITFEYTFRKYKI